MFNMIKTTAIAALMVPAASGAFAGEVEIYLTDMLDNTQVGYCVDIGGGKDEGAKVESGLQGHTCYSNLGALGVDQVFDTDKFADGILYMPNFEVCAEAAGTEAGSLLALASCDGSDAQSFVFTGEGTITPASDPSLCFTVAEETRSGRSSANQIKVLSLETCSADLAAYQDWAVRGVE